MAWIMKLITKTPSSTPTIKVVIGARSVKSVPALAVIPVIKSVGSGIIDNIFLIASFFV